MRLILLENSNDLDAVQEEKFEFVIKAASGELSFDEIKTWIEAHLK